MSAGHITLADQYQIEADTSSGVNGQWIDASGTDHTHVTMALTGDMTWITQVSLPGVGGNPSYPSGFIGDGITFLTSVTGSYVNQSDAGIGWRGRAIVGDWGHYVQMGDPGGTDAGWCFHVNAAYTYPKIYTEVGVTLGNNGTSIVQQLDGTIPYVTIVGSFESDAPVDSTSGPTAGTITYAQAFAGSAYKEVEFYLSGYENDTTTDQTIAFPSAFTVSPIVSTDMTGLTVSADTTSLTITSPDSTTLYTGWITVEGW